MFRIRAFWFLWNLCYDLDGWRKTVTFRLPQTIGDHLISFAEKHLHLTDAELNLIDDEPAQTGPSEEMFILEFKKFAGEDKYPCEECDGYGGDLLAPGCPCPTCGLYSSLDDSSFETESYDNALRKTYGLD